ncbi:hypothetical protein EVAR_69915_1 [Eumeta japonica]|uniref:Uncharacterized protein n=1 Tax=Eumeta variegata TaxID=151549 RepID=A0A4C1T196_EUMVA|nr:hypothetical protein EVAR_69915_1 [Eumeta japonica]
MQMKTLPVPITGIRQQTVGSANPLVMNHQLPAPSVTNTTTNNSTTQNNSSSLDDLDPFGNSKHINNTNTQANTSLYKTNCRLHLSSWVSASQIEC